MSERERSAGVIARALGIGGPKVRMELWTWASLSVFAAFVFTLFYLGSRPGGTGPIWAYVWGRTILGLVALGLLLVGVVLSAIRRPFLQRRRGRGFVGLALVIGLANVRLPYPSSHEGHPSPIPFRLPVAGPWQVYWGGEGKDDNMLGGFFPDRRWAMHLVKAVDGRRIRGPGPAREPSEFLAWNEPILAPASGTVVLVRDDIPDSELGVVSRDVPAFGNLVVIEVRGGEYLFLYHLLAGSIRAAEGQAVEAGMELARVGYSGYSPVTPEPHVALHLQDTPDEGLGEAIPWFFHGYTSNGRPVERGLPHGGIGTGGELRGELVAHR